MRLDETKILEHLFLSMPLAIHVFPQIDSTNTFLKNQPSTGKIQICCAEEQTQGRGRFGRTWHSPFGDNIYFSIRIPLECPFNELSGLSLMVSLVVIDTLTEFGVSGLKVKWPNDIIWSQRKLSGCLIELVLNKSLLSEVVVGIGINVNGSYPDWCSIYDITGKNLDRNMIIAKLTQKMIEATQLFMNEGFPAFKSQWQAVDSLYSHLITLYTPSETFNGTVLGVDDDGRLILKDNDGGLHFFLSGEASQQSIGGINTCE